MGLQSDALNYKARVVSLMFLSARDGCHAILGQCHLQG